MQTIQSPPSGAGGFVNERFMPTAPTKALALDVVNTARRIAVLTDRSITRAAAEDAARAITTMRSLLDELEAQV